jgi:hypothetical protein
MKKPDSSPPLIASVTVTFLILFTQALPSGEANGNLRANAPDGAEPILNVEMPDILPMPLWWSG